MPPARWLSEDEHRAWRLLLRMQGNLSARMNRDLQRLADLSLPDYDVLVNLSEAPDGRLRPFELGEALQWEQSRVSHQVRRMQQRGLVAREECSDDGRGSVVALTPAGRQRLIDAAPAHVASVRELVFDGLDADTVATLERLCREVLTRLDGAAGKDVRAVSS